MRKKILVCLGGALLLFVGIASILKFGRWGEILAGGILILLGGIILYEGMARIFWLKKIFKRINFERR